MAPPTLNGLPERDRPILDISGNQTYWDMRKKVSDGLIRSGHRNAAAEFRYLAEHECDGDNGMLFTLALNYIRVPEQEPTEL